MKAVCLLSGGLDSILAARIIQDQGIKVYALNFTSPFCLCNQKGKCFAVDISNKLNIPLKAMVKGTDYIRLIRKPKYGHGKGINPCVDCRIYILKKAKKYAKDIGAKFIFTGEVLDERPMSQHMKALRIIEKDAGLKGKLLRPLSAKLLPETEAEKKGWVNRDKLLSIQGRSRKPQIDLTKKFGIIDYPCPAGGCLLTDKEFTKKFKDLLKHKKKITTRDIELLKIGRHFRSNNNKIIVGRNEKENKLLINLKNKTDYVFEVIGCGSPTTLLQGKKTKDVINLAAELTARYSDSKNEITRVNYNDRRIGVKKISEKDIDSLRI